MGPDAPIGVFDSGVGGLTVLKELRRQLGGESTIYLGDEARMPYGPRPAAEVIAFTREAMRWFAKRDCKLIVLEGPELAGTDLSMGRGWSNAERSAENVTRQLIDAATGPTKPVVAVLAEADATRGEIARMLGRLELETAPWAELRGRILSPAKAESGPGYAAVLVTEGAEPTASWLFDAGLARGALGPRAVVAQLGDTPIPAQLAGIDVIRLVPDDETSLRALADRLIR